MKRILTIPAILFIIPEALYVYFNFLHCFHGMKGLFTVFGVSVDGKIFTQYQISRNKNSGLIRLVPRQCTRLNKQIKKPRTKNLNNGN